MDVFVSIGFSICVLVWAKFDARRKRMAIGGRGEREDLLVQEELQFDCISFRVRKQVTNARVESFSLLALEYK